MRRRTRLQKNSFEKFSRTFTVDLIFRDKQKMSFNQSEIWRVYQGNKIHTVKKKTTGPRTVTLVNGLCWQTKA